MNRESHIVLVLLFLFFFQLYSTSKFKIKSKTCSVSNHLSNKMLYLKIIGYEMGVALLVGLWWLVLRLSSAGGRCAGRSLSMPMDHCFSPLGWSEFELEMIAALWKLVFILTPVFWQPGPFEPLLVSRCSSSTQQWKTEEKCLFSCIGRVRILFFI